MTRPFFSILICILVSSSCADSKHTFDGDKDTSITVSDGETFRIGFDVDLATFSCNMVDSGDDTVISYTGSESTPQSANPDSVKTYFNFETVDKGSTSVTINCTNDDTPTIIDVTVE